MRGGYNPSLMVKDLDDQGGKLIIFKCIPYLVLPHPDGPEHLVLLPSLENAGATPLGVADSYEKALEYVQTLDKKHLREVA